MAIPVLIPARNEEAFIGSALAGLNREHEPIVIANACEDATARVAEKFGATVLSMEEGGRILALQEAIMRLGGRALDPFLIMDADSRPASRFWADALCKRLVDGGGRPTVVSGPLLFSGSPDRITNAVRSVQNWRRQVRGMVHPDGPRIFCGANQAVWLRDDRHRQAVMELPNYWPGSDKALTEAVTGEDGVHLATISPYALVVTDGARSVSFREVLRHGYRASKAANLQSYFDEAPTSSLPNRTS